MSYPFQNVFANPSMTGTEVQPLQNPPEGRVKTLVEPASRRAFRCIFDQIIIGAHFLENFPKMRQLRPGVPVPLLLLLLTLHFPVPMAPVWVARFSVDQVHGLQNFDQVGIV